MESHALLKDIGLCVMASASLAVIATRLKQPVLLGYLASGILLGPLGFSLVTDKASIDLISELGLILLLFMIGMEMDVNKIIKSGKAIVLTGVLQFLLSFAFFYGIFHFWNLFPDANFDKIYASVCLSLSSTMIVVKLLYEKFELDTRAGRITIGILIFQDIYAIVFISLRSSLEDPKVFVLFESLFRSAILILLAFLVANYLLVRIFKFIAKSPELVLMSSLAWCFSVAGLANYLHLSSEMGALIAGVSLSSFPYNVDVVSRVVTLRDFFITLFFVGLGMKIPLPTFEVGMIALGISFLVIASRFLVIFPILASLKQGRRIAFLTSLNLSQVSEFSLVIASMGMASQHISNGLLTILIYALVITATLSTYAIKYSHKLQIGFLSLASLLGFLDKAGQMEKEEFEHNKEWDVVILGFFRFASSILEELDSFSDFEKEKILVIDYNPELITKVRDKGYSCYYGDIANFDTLGHIGLSNSKILIVTIPDSIFKGTTNLKLMKALKGLAPKSKIVLTADTVQQAVDFYTKGADYVITPSVAAARNLIPLLEKLHSGKIETALKLEKTELKRRKEIVT